MPDLNNGSGLTNGSELNDGAALNDQSWTDWNFGPGPNEREHNGRTWHKTSAVGVWQRPLTRQDMTADGLGYRANAIQYVVNGTPITHGQMSNQRGQVTGRPPEVAAYESKISQRGPIPDWARRHHQDNSRRVDFNY